MIGKTLAHYEITALLGKGGMGEVYRARDGKLGREVAIKILPAELSGDPERTARFDREARTLASLQHPNVASIYGFEEVEGTRFLVMELVEGRDLSSRIAEGNLSLDRALAIARQIATGLEAAHERGIVHRDLKPANIMLNDQGEAKILDFGLATAWFGDNTDTDVGTSPTITAAMTQAGTILGTVAYMSPEQARGRSVDRRADIWAFGAILWEMVTGQRLFEGDTISDTLAAVLRAEPDWDLLPVKDAPRLCHLIERCLVRDPQLRLRDIGEARILLTEGGVDSSVMMQAPADVDPNLNRGRAGWIVAVAMAVVAAVLGSLFLTRDAHHTLSQTTLGLPNAEATNLTGGTGWSSIQISPDGSSVIYIGGRPGDLYLRQIDSFEPTKIAGTQGATLPAFSPDGQWIAFFANSKIWKVAVSGGAPVEICNSGGGPGLTWGNGEIYFCRTNGGGIWAVSEDGGEPRKVSTLDDARDETSHRWPQLLPDGRHLLVTIKTASIITFDDAFIGLLSMETGEVTVLLQGGTNPRYISTGHLIYGRNFQLFSVPFDLKSLAIDGTPTSVLDGIHISDLTGSTHYTLSPQGHLAYIPSLPNFWDFELVMINEFGQTSPVEVEPSRAFDVAMAPGDEMFAAVVPAANDKIWLYDLKRKTTSRLTNTSGNDRRPVWSPDKTRIVFQNDRDGSRDLYSVPVDGSGPAELVLQNEFNDRPDSWSPDGRHLLLTRTKPDGDNDIWVVNMDGEFEARPFLETPNRERGGKFSPDGKWVAYVSDSSGERDIYVRPFAGQGNPIRISISGGSQPFWSPDATRLFYVNEKRLMAVATDLSVGFQAGEPKELFLMSDSMVAPFSKLAPTFDGKLFFGGQFNLDAEQSQIRVIFDWVERMKTLESGR